MDELYVLARRVLLDALKALGPHREACVLAGAQAIYLRVGDADLAVAPFTTDGDLVIDPRRPHLATGCAQSRPGSQALVPNMSRTRALAVAISESTRRRS